MGKTNLAGSRVRAAAADDWHGGYFIFADGSLLKTGAGGVQAEVVAEVPTITEVAHGTGDGRLEGKEHKIRLDVHGPWVCVSERFGVNAALVNTESGSVRPLNRGDYHSDVSSYSIGFLNRGGRVLLVAQTEWNRLDIFDAQTGHNLTEREVSVRDTGGKNERGQAIHEYKNYLDYFHSTLHVSPDSRHFLSNGWVWSPVDMVLTFSTEAFLNGWERTGARIMGSGYNWDRPCTFIDDERFVLAMDDQSVAGGLDEDELATYSYRQLALFTIPDLPAGDGNSLPWLEPTALVSCDVLPRNDYGEVKGELHYDPQTRCLVAMTESDGTYLVSLTGQVINHLPEISLGTAPAHRDMDSRNGSGHGWAYSTQRRRFYRWLDGTGIAERAIDGAP